MFFWVLKKETALEAVHEGGKKEVFKLFYPLGKYVFCIASLLALVLGAMYGGIG